MLTNGFGNNFYQVMILKYRTYVLMKKGDHKNRLARIIPNLT